MEVKSKTTNILNLVVIGLAILAIIMFRKNYKDSFIDMGPVGSQPYPPTLNWYYPSNNPYAVPQTPINPQLNYYPPQNMNNLANLNAQPLGYNKQMYPKIPYFSNVGRPCVGNDCGATSSCVAGYCQPNQGADKTTVFNVPNGP